VVGPAAKSFPTIAQPDATPDSGPVRSTGDG